MLLLIFLAAFLAVPACLAQGNNVCSSCCPESCNVTSSATTLSRAAGGYPQGYTIPGGSVMTCFLEDKDHSSTSDVGLCIPNGVPNVTTFCSDIDDLASHKVVPTVLYQNVIEEAKACSPCCDGKSVCGQGLQCLRTASPNQVGGVCVPKGTIFDPAYCGTKTGIVDEMVACQSCGAQQTLVSQQSQGTTPESDQQNSEGNPETSQQALGSNQANYYPMDAFSPQLG
jgi:hypothetical protein